jgi:LCP family protein required for cell wall assembly
MDCFRTRKIRKKPPLQLVKKAKESLFHFSSLFKGLERKRWNIVIGSILALVGALVVVKVTWAGVDWVRNFDPKNLLSSVGSDLKKDSFGHINVVVLGDGGHVRDGADLVDSIMVASLDPTAGTVSMFSIPRDYYVKSPEFGTHKINEMYRNFKKEMGDDAYSMFAKAASLVTGQDVPYYIRVDFNGFVDVVDALGGITVDVKEAISDPYYPNDNDDGYTLFQIQPGVQQMDGETALKYARSRKTTSDFDRSRRQQQVLMAIKDKAMSENILTNPALIGKLYKTISESLNTNLSLTEMITLASLARKIDRTHVISKVLTDDPLNEGGFLYTPERQLTGGLFGLLPIGDNLDQIHQYADLVLNQRDMFFNPARVEVLNATKEPGIARAKADALKRFGFNVVNIDNLLGKDGKRKNVDKSFIRYNTWDVDKDGNVIPHFQSTLEALAGIVKGEPMPNDQVQPDAKADISVVIGQDAVK